MFSGRYIPADCAMPPFDNQRAWPVAAQGDRSVLIQMEVERRAAEGKPRHAMRPRLLDIPADASRRRVDLDAAFAGVPEGSFRILLAHEPDMADHLDGHRVDLQLSGHTHGGQVVLPLVGPLILPILGRRYIKGLDRLATHTLYTSRGLGGVPPFARLNCPPEATVLTLTRQ